VDSNYLFLCGVMWCKFGQVDAAKELARAADSSDANLRALPCAMLTKGMRCLRHCGSGRGPALAQCWGECPGNGSESCVQRIDVV
jgi:hypothetical protein